LGTRLRRSGLLQPTAYKVLAFALVCLLVLAVLAARIGNISFFSHRTTYSAQLADATGLHPADDVKVAGVTVGQVTGVSLQRAHALVTFTVNDTVHLRRGTQVGLQWHNVLGQQFLYLYPSSTGSALRSGETLPLSNNVAGANVGALLNSLGPLLGALHPKQANEIVQSFADALQGNETQVDQLINNAASVSQAVGSVDTQVGQVIGNLNQVFGALSQRSGDLGQVVDNLQTLSASLAGHNDLLNQTVGNLGTVAKEVATLEADTHGSLSSAVSDLQAVSSVIQSHAGDLSRSLSTLGPGLAPYIEISGYGQWFEIQTVYSCMANETSCNYYEGGNAPAGSGPFGSPPSSGPPAPAGASGARPQAARPGAGGASGLGQVIGAVAGQPTSAGGGR
jgi:phospholipid/cholesterol/gamma-HCH transport system substrate-binding protein